MQGKTHPGLNRKEVTEILPDIIIGEDQEITDDEGWYKKETIETTEELIERVKDVVRDFKEFHRKNPNETIVVISHGCFLRTLMSVLTAQHHLLPEARFHSNNNSLTILDLETMTSDKPPLEYVDVKLMAYNLQLIEGTNTEVAKPDKDDEA